MKPAARDSRTIQLEWQLDMVLYGGFEATLCHTEATGHSWSWARMCFQREAGRVGSRFVLVTFLATVKTIPGRSNLREEGFYFCSRLLEIQPIVVAGRLALLWGCGSMLCAACSFLGRAGKQRAQAGIRSVYLPQPKAFFLRISRPQSQSSHSLHRQCRSWGPHDQRHVPGKTFHTQHMPGPTEGG